MNVRAKERPKERERVYKYINKTLNALGYHWNPFWLSLFVCNNMLGRYIFITSLCAYFCCWYTSCMCMCLCVCGRLCRCFLLIKYFGSVWEMCGMLV